MVCAELTVPKKGASVAFVRRPSSPLYKKKNSYFDGIRCSRTQETVAEEEWCFEAQAAEFTPCANGWENLHLQRKFR